MPFQYSELILFPGLIRNQITYAKLNAENTVNIDSSIA